MPDTLELRSHRLITMVAAAALICAIGALDFTLPRAIPLSIAYILPVALIGAVGSRWHVLLVAVLCTGVSEWTDAYVWNVREGVARDLLVGIALAAVGLYIHEFLTKEAAERAHLQALSEENAARREAEEQSSLLIGSSVLAIITLTEEGHVVQANGAARRMFTGEDEPDRAIVGLHVGQLLPSLARAAAKATEHRPMRTVMQAQGVRLDGELFLAEVWFSTYGTKRGRRTTAMVVDISEEFRSREEAIAEQLISSSRLAVGAMAHEMRNVCGAIRLVTQSLALQTPDAAKSENMQALRELTSVLERMASVELSQVKRYAARTPLNVFFAELRVVAQAILLEQGIEFFWEIGEDLPSVWADTEGLMQVFLNLLRNAQQALVHTADPEVHIASELTGRFVQVRVRDNGPGVPESVQLFQPFQSSGPVTSLGLYLSRAILNSFRGDLRYEPQPLGAQFAVELEVVS